MDMLTEMEMQVNPEYRVIKNTDGRRYSAYEQYEREGTEWQTYMKSRETSSDS
jgi:hypothetical protein